MDPSRGRLTGKLALRPAGYPALVHREYRRAPCPPPVQRHSLLPPAAGAPRSSRPSRREPTHAAWELPLRAPRALGRGAERPTTWPPARAATAAPTAGARAAASAVPWGGPARGGLFWGGGRRGAARRAQPKGSGEGGPPRGCGSPARYTNRPPLTPSYLL